MPTLDEARFRDFPWCSTRSVAMNQHWSRRSGQSPRTRDAAITSSIYLRTWRATSRTHRRCWRQASPMRLRSSYAGLWKRRQTAEV
jgi:hypothetical protein